ncbi:MAG: Mur ligase domain-containing protein, partial [Oscillospiraceae bacterium]|nr:Mur ligase domain-containing protein [Oscillospiraceae bacterium]
MNNNNKNNQIADLLKPGTHIHMIGIGGSGMYPLAQILHARSEAGGFALSGSDNNLTDTVEAVRAMGIDVFMGHNPENIANLEAGCAVIVRSAAIKDDNAEIAAARA